MSTWPDSANPLSHDDELSPRSLIVRLALGILVLLVGAIFLATFAYEPIQSMSEPLVDRFGLAFVFVGVVLTDSLMFTNEPILLVAHAGGLGFWPVVWVASVASIAAGVLGWLVGGQLGRLTRVKRLMARYRIGPFMERYGVYAVGVAALTPFPYSVATWSAGAAGVPLVHVLLGSLLRVPRVVFWFGIMLFGFEVVPRWFGLG